MSKPTLDRSGNEPSVLRKNAMLALGFFLAMVLLSVLIVFPKVDHFYETKYRLGVEKDMALEVNLFKDYVAHQASALQDLTKLPSLVNALMSSDVGSHAIADLFYSELLDSDTDRVVLQNSEGAGMLDPSKELIGNYSETAEWTERLLQGKDPYYFKLLNQLGDHLSYQVSVPLAYRGRIQGVLSAEITKPINDVFADLGSRNDIAIKLVQDHITVSSTTTNIKVLHESSLELEELGMTFVYITDGALIKDKLQSVRDAMLLILLAGLSFTFLLIILYGYRQLLFNSKPKNLVTLHARAYIVPIIVVIFGVAASVTTFLIINNYQLRVISDRELAESKIRLWAIQESVDRNFDMVSSIRSFFESSDFVSRREFKTYVSDLVAKNKDIQALGWIPNVPHSQRAERELDAQSDGLIDYEFLEIDSQKKMVVASERDIYSPVYYVEPLDTNRGALGFDLRSHGVRLAALNRASTNSNIVATAPIELVVKPESQTGILMFRAVYKKDQTGSVLERNLQNVRGFVLLVLRASDMIDGISTNENFTGFVNIQDISDFNNPESFYASAIELDEVVLSETIDVGGRTWRIDIQTKAKGQPTTWISWLVLLAGLVIVVLIVAGLFQLIRRREVVEALVKEKTADLQMLSSIVKNSNDMFAVTTAGGVSGGQAIIYVNDEYTRFTGFNRDEIIGKSLTLTQGENSDLHKHREIQQMLTRGETFQGELLAYTKNREEYWADFHISPLRDENDVITRFAIVQRDITERKNAHAEREKMIGELTDSNEELERFAFVCSHDLQEPLRMIRSFSEKLQIHMGDVLEDDEKGKKYFRFITDGATRAQDLIADILSYSSINNDTQISEVFSSQELVDSIQKIMCSTLADDSVKITRDELPELQGNKTQLYQLFQNLINNAIKYQSPDSSPHVHIGVKDAGEFWQFSIKDNGIGMEQRHLDKIFDVFQRLHRKSQYAGTGVGLSICKKVVTRHGGTVWVESEIGVGSTFYFTLLKPMYTEVGYDEQRKVG